jgi:hypothetical protein
MTPMPNHFLLIEDPDDATRQRVSVYTPDELAAWFTDRERAILADGGTIRQDRYGPWLVTDTLAFIRVTIAARQVRVTDGAPAVDSPLRVALRNAHLRRQELGAG